MNPQRFRVVFKAQADHRVQNILAADRFALLQLTLLRGLRRYEADELGNALLHAFLCVLCDFGGGRDGRFHDTGDVGDLYMRRES